MNKFSNKKFFIILQRDWAHKHGFEIAKKLHENGAKLSCLIFKPSVEYYIDSQKNIKFENILKNSDIENNTETILKNSDYNFKRFSNDFNVENFWEHAPTLRKLTLSYKKKYPFSFQQNWTDEEISKYILAFGYKIKKLFDEFKPDISIGYNFGDIRHYLINQICDKEKTPFFCVSGTKVSGNACFAYDYKGDKSFFKNHNIKLNNKNLTSKNIGKAENYYTESLKKLKQPSHMTNVNVQKPIFDLKGLKFFIKKIIYHFKKKDINKKIIDGNDNTSFLYLIRDFISERINLIRANSLRYDKLDEIKEFVYLPLQHYPESQLGLVNTTHDNQINTVRIIARHLPRNLTLVVKDHPWSQGKKSLSYLLKLKNTINVKLIDYRISNKDIYKKMSYLVSFGGTSIFEAAFEKKPAIQLGNFGAMSELPNLYYLENLNLIGQKINQIDKEFNLLKNNELYHKKLINYIAAAFDKGFDVDKYNDDLRTNKNSLDYIWSKYSQEIESIFKYKDRFNFN